MEQSVVLTLVNSKHSKQYNVALEQKGSLWVVNFAYGAIGSPLKAGTKTASPVALEKAEQVYRKLIEEKAGKACSCCGGSYTIAGEPRSAGRASAPGATKVQSIAPEVDSVTFEPELLEPVDVHASGRLINSGSYGCMKKYDGHRHAVLKSGNWITSFNRLGKKIDPPAAVMAAVGELADDVMLDGEFIHGEFIAFDLLRLNDLDTRGLPFQDRYEMLAEVCGDKVLVAPLAIGKAEIMALIEREHETNGEGVVFKRLDGSYMPGRQGTNKKFKFWASATFRICAKQKTASKAQAHSFGVEALKDGVWTYCGSVTCKGPLPAVGSYREVKYLYVAVGGNVYQPEDWGAREDVTDADCSWSQLKLKQEKELAI